MASPEKASKSWIGNGIPTNKKNHWKCDFGHGKVV
jgi:hypothetical protein